MVTVTTVDRGLNAGSFATFPTIGPERLMVDAVSRLGDLVAVYVHHPDDRLSGTCMVLDADTPVIIG